MSCSSYLLVLLLVLGMAAQACGAGNENLLIPEVVSPKQEILIAKNQIQAGDYEGAASSFWSAIMRNDKSLDLDDLKNALDLFLFCYKKQGIPEEGLLKIGRQFILQGLVQEGTNYLNTALSINPHLLDVHMILMKVTDSIRHRVMSYHCLSLNICLTHSPTLSPSLQLFFWYDKGTQPFPS